MHEQVNWQGWDLLRRRPPGQQLLMSGQAGAGAASVRSLALSRSDRPVQTYGVHLLRHASEGSNWEKWLGQSKSTTTSLLTTSAGMIRCNQHRLQPSHKRLGSPGTLRAVKVVTLDFEARVPVPFSVFPSAYREKEVETKTTKTHEEIEVKLSDKPGREGQFSSVSASVQVPPRQEQRISEQEVRFTREEERYPRPGVQVTSERFEQHRPSYSSFTETSVEVDRKHIPQYSSIDRIEREYRARAQPSYKESFHVTGATVDPPRSTASYSHQAPVTGTTVDGFQDYPSYPSAPAPVTGVTVDASKPVPTYTKETKVVEETIQYPRYTSPTSQKSRMGYYDEDGHYHSIRHGLHKMADKILPHSHHHHHHDVEVVRESASVAAPAPASIPNTVTIPCHHIRMGDILMLQGRPCQVIRISTSAATGQHRYLGVDLFTKQLHEESSFISNPAPSVVVQTMLGPILKQYRVLDLQEGNVVAMTESGEVKTGLPVIDQGGLWERLSRAFSTGRGSVRILVISDNGRELAVDSKVVHGSSL
ncbi:uncharacterized protein B0I36DRAFT_345495 [Microdochium trichocladiopsis]|uniref:Translation initiation factor 5A-like N-terminal domain-containing protein n=1 Tax=Microdochium trichocladiopsis TaxID=1682393 RepID=A0A9P9BXT4_9PEZI|nr:uncharacterized protein B0I36DRAFT_345495 [Microdochium trichocladiopsis]KAH7037363.1 hypothetical protein B0I36DRAFT_345495 [Microdochium trichocladiopsis]